MLIYINKKLFFLRNEKKIKYCLFNEEIKKDIEKIIITKENFFNKNEIILTKLNKFCEEKELKIKGIGNEIEIKKIKEAINKNRFETVKNFNKEEYEEIVSYPLVLKELRKRILDNVSIIENFSNSLKRYIEANKTKEEEIFSEKIRKKNLIETEIKKIIQLYNNDKKVVEKETELKIKNINKKIKALEKNYKAYINIKRKIEQLLKKISNIDIEIKLLSKKEEILEFKKKNNGNCWKLYKIILLVLTLGLIYWTGIFDCEVDIKIIKKKKNKLYIRKKKLELRIEKLNSKIKNNKFITEKEKLEKEKEDIIRTRDKNLKNLENYLNLVNKKKEELLKLDSEITNLKNVSLDTIKKKLDELNKKYTNNLLTVEKLLNRFNKQNIDKNIKSKVIRINIDK